VGLFDFIFKNHPKENGDFAGAFRLLNGYEPHFTSWGGQIYEAELVRAAINTIATNISKLRVETHGSAHPALMRKLAHAPNAVETWSQFLARCATILYVHNNALITPIYDEYGETNGIFCVLPNRSEVVQYDVGGKVVPYLRYEFSNGERAAIEFSKCGIMKRHQYKNDLFGETNAALNPTMDLIHVQNEGTKNAVKNSASYRFVATMGNYAKPEDIEKERLRFSEKNLSKDAKSGGLLLFPNTYTNVQQLKASPYTVDAAQMGIINEGVCNYFGVSKEAMQNKLTGDEAAAFYEGVCEPFAIQFSEVVSKMFFTPRELTEGNRVFASANRLQFMSNKDKLDVSAAMADRGIMNRDEIREIWNLPPMPNGEGQKFTIRGEYYSADEKLRDQK
jgi:hypothetical protein